MATAHRTAGASTSAAPGPISGPPGAGPNQLAIYKIYTSNAVQASVAMIIIGNFVVTILEKEYDPYPEEQQISPKLWQTFDSVFNILFAVELIVNMAGSWFVYFWRNPWNVFDFVVVLVGLLSMLNLLQGPLEDLKMLRAFRVFRLFKRIKSLNKIVTALVKAIPGVFNAFVIMLIVMCIYAILAVEYFRPFGEDGTYTTEHLVGMVDGREIYNFTKVDAYTARELKHGQEYYGTFSRALYTLFQVLTGESWAEAVARPLIFGQSPRNAFGPALFFTSFILVTQIVLVNVVVAVLLDKFVTDDSGSLPSAHASGDDEHPEPVSSSELQTNVAGLCSDVSKIKSELGNVMALKGRLDQLLDALESEAKADGAGANSEYQA